MQQPLLAVSNISAKATQWRRPFFTFWRHNNKSLEILPIYELQTCRYAAAKHDLFFRDSVFSTKSTPLDR